MTLLAIPNAINSAISSLSGHGHKKGVNGSENAALNGSASSAEQSGTTQGLFGTLMDSAEQLVGIQTPTSTPAATNAHAVTGTPAAHGSKLSAAAMITAARTALP